MAKYPEADGGEAELRKLAAIGQVVTGIAHDFNNLLTVIAGFAQLALMDDNPARAGLEQILVATERASSLTRRLVTFGRPGEPEPRIFEVNQMLLDLAKMLRRLMGENIEVSTQIGAGPLTAKADPNQTEQEIFGHAVDARGAMPGGGKLILSSAATGDFCTVAISCLPAGDTSIQHLATIFLPAGSGRPEMLLAPTGASIVRGTETILVVDDDPMVLDLVCRSLSAGGFRVLRAGNGDDALEVLHAQGPSGVDLLITDVIMPGMLGPALAERAVELLPRLKVLFMSGYAEAAIRRHLTRDGVALIRKPFGLRELTGKVREVLA